MSTQMITGLLLDAGGEFSPAAPPGGRPPARRNGLPVFPFWKEVMRPGPVRDARGKEWVWTAADTDAAVADGNRSLALGHEPVVQNDHRNPTESYGFIGGYRRNARGGLDWLHLLLGERARDAVLTRKTSVCLLPDYTDPHRNRYRWFPDHSAAVFRPQHKYLGDFQDALAASGERVMAMTLSAADDAGPANAGVELAERYNRRLTPAASDAAAERATLRSSYGLPPEPAAATGAEALERAELRRLYGLPDAPAK